MTFWADLGPLDPNSDRQFLFSKIWFHQSLDIMVSYHVKYQKKLMIQSGENLVTNRWSDRETDRWE